MTTPTTHVTLALLAGIATVVSLGTNASAAGNLARKCTELPELVLGTDEAGFAVSEKAYTLQTGACYQLTIKSTGRKEYALRGADFFRAIWLRKLEAGGMEIKATHLHELEFEEAAQVDLFFVPIVDGTFTLAAEGLAAKGTSVTFKIK